MQNELQGLLQQFTAGQGDTQQLAQAAEQHINSASASEVQQHLEAAADNAESNGNGDLASTIRQMLAQHGGGESIKSEAITLIKNNPQILQHFAPSFAQGILSRI